MKLTKSIQTRTANERVLTDWRGNSYTVGDTILYPVSGTSGSDLRLVEAVIEEIYEYDYEDGDEPLVGLQTQPIRETVAYMLYTDKASARKEKFRRTNLKDLSKVTKI